MVAPKGALPSLCEELRLTRCRCNLQPSSLNPQPCLEAAASPENTLRTMKHKEIPRGLQRDYQVDHVFSSS